VSDAGKRLLAAAREMRETTSDEERARKLIIDLAFAAASTQEAGGINFGKDARKLQMSCVIAAFAQARAEEAEACARIADEHAAECRQVRDSGKINQINRVIMNERADSSDEIAAAIRARHADRLEPCVYPNCDCGDLDPKLCVGRRPRASHAARRGE
jgi:hypothetical protein